MATNCTTTDCTGQTGPDHTTPGTSTSGSSGCTTQPSGKLCPPIAQDLTCSEFQLVNSPDACYIDSLVNESLNIGGAVLNVYKLLGVHEQGKLLDVTGNGQPLSNGNLPNFPALNAFDKFATEWRSIQRGVGVTASAYLGYDFGEIKTIDNSRRLYGIDTSVRKHITAFSIKQSSNALSRVTRLRVERSIDGTKWYGVAVVTVPDNDCLNTILFNDSVPSRYWRLRPLDFAGGATDYWGVQALQLYHNFVATNDYNIQDKILLENRDRDYATDPTIIKGSYDLVDVTTELSRFGIELPSQTMYVNVNFSACVAILGRPLVIGDILEVPSEKQFSSDLRPILKWMEVTDVAWSTDGYTPGWQPTLQRIILQPAYVTQETQDIFGDLAENPVPDGLGLVDKGDGQNPNYQDWNDVSQTVEAEAKDAVPEKGREVSSTIRDFEYEELQSAAAQGFPHLQKVGQNPEALYAEDGMPPNNAPFTEGTVFPVSPVHGDYHRLTYDGLSKDIPTRLYRYSSAKGRWVFLERDKRAQFNPTRPRLQEFLTSPTAQPHNKV